MFATTGVVLLIPGVHFLTFVAHVGMAVMVTPLMLGHIYMAAVNRDTRVGLSGMLSGQVDRDWARHHYPRWYRELFGDTETAPAGPLEPVGVPVLALIRCGHCATKHLVNAEAVATEHIVNVRLKPCPLCGAVVELDSVVAEPGRADAIFAALEESGIRVMPAGLPVETTSALLELEESAEEMPRQACNA